MPRDAQRMFRSAYLGEAPAIRSRELYASIQVVTDYLTSAGLQEELDKLGFSLVGYGCTTCIGNSGPLSDEISATIDGGAVSTEREASYQARTCS